MAAPLMLEKWSGQVSTVTIGATKEEGGTRSHAIRVGGQQTLPFLFQEALLPNKPVIAFEIWDTQPQDWQADLQNTYGASLKDPFSWAEKCVKDYKARLLCVRLQGAHPDSGDKTPQEQATLIKELLKRVGVPLIIIGSGDDIKDNEVLPACCEIAKGERCLIGSAVQDN